MEKQVSFIYKIITNVGYSFINLFCTYFFCEIFDFGIYEISHLTIASLGSNFT